MKLAVVLTLALVACKSGKHQEPAPTNGLELVSPGAEPRKLLRYAAPKGTKAMVELALDTSLSAGEQHTTTPTIAFVFELVVDDVLPNGAMKVHMTVTDTSAREHADSPVPPTATDPAREAMRGVTVEGMLSPDGTLTDTHVAGDKKPPPERAADLDLLVTNFGRAVRPLPDVPVGVGATWRSTQALENGGLKMTATNTTVVTKLDGELGYTSSATIAGPDQVVRLEGTPIHVEHLAGNAEGHGTIDLSKLVFAGELNATVSSEMSAENERTPMKMSAKLVMTPR